MWLHPDSRIRGIRLCGVYFLRRCVCHHDQICSTGVAACVPMTMTPPQQVSSRCCVRFCYVDTLLLTVYVNAAAWIAPVPTQLHAAIFASGLCSRLDRVDNDCSKARYSELASAELWRPICMDGSCVGYGKLLRSETRPVQPSR